MTQIHFKIFVLIILISSCATKNDQDFLNIESDDIEKELKLEKNLLDKFVVKENVEIKNKKKVVETPKTDTPEKKTLSEKNEPVKPVIKENKSNGSKEKTISNLASETENEVEESVVTSTKQEKKLLPPEYSEKFKEYDKESKKAWDAFEPKIFLGEKITLRVGYLGITAGHIQLETLPPVFIGENKTFHFKAKMRSARYYSYIYSLDDSLESFPSINDFTPLKYVLMQRESAQTVDDLQLFDREKLKTFHFYKRLKEGKRKELELEKDIPFYFQDSFSALYFVRGLPLTKGSRYQFPIVTRGKIWLLELLVEREEVIDVNGKDVKAIRVNAETRFPGVLEKKGDILFWYSADEKRTLLKFEAQVKIGSVEGEMVEYIPGKPLKVEGL